MATWQGFGTGNWSSSLNWLFFTPPNSSTDASIGTGNATVDTLGLEARNVFLFGNRTVDAGFGGGLGVTGNFDIAFGSSLVVRNGGSVSASRYDVSGKLVVGGAGVAEAGGSVTGAVNLLSGGLLIFNTNNAVTFSNVISGAGSVEQKGSGTVVALTGTNTYSGATTVTSGELRLFGSQAVGDLSAVTVSASATLTLLGSSETIGSLSGSGSVVLRANETLATGGNNTSTTFSGVISDSSAFPGAGALTKTGSGTMTLSGANTYTGTTTVSGGVLNIQNATALGTTAGGTSVTGGAALEISGGITVGAEALTLNGTGIGNIGALRNVSGNNVVDGLITLASATRINTDAGQVELNGNITGTGTNLTVGGTGTTTIAGNITTGAGSLTVDATLAGGIVQLTGNNSFTGGTTVSSGFLQLLSGSALADGGALTVNSPGTVQVGFGETVGALSGAGRIALQTTFALVAGGAAGTTTFSGQIIESGAVGAFTKAGAGTLILSGANTYTGVTNVSAGVLRIENASALGTTAGGTTVAANASLAVAGSISVGEVLTLNGTGIGNTGALRNISAINAWTGAITLASEARINVDSGNLFLTGGTSGTDQNLTLGGVGTMNVNSTIATGAGTLTKDGAGTVRLGGANNYTGVTTVNEGVLFLIGGNAIADTGAVVVNAPGRLEIAASETIGSLAGGGAVTLINFGGGGTITLTTGGNNANTTFSGVISTGSGATALTKTGTGTFTLSGANTYTGTTTVNAGVLNVTGSVASLSNVVNSTGTLRVDGASLDNSATVTLNGTGILDVAGDLEQIAGLISASTTSSVTLGGNTLVLNGDGDVALTESTTFAGVISGTGGLIKTGNDIQVLSGTNTYTGSTTVAGGELHLNGGAAIVNTNAVVVNGGRLEVNAAETIGTLAGGAAGIVDLNANTLTIGGNATAGVQSTDFGGAIVGTGRLTKTGIDTQVLSGANTYTGTTTVSAGTLAISNASALGTTAGGTTVAANAALQISGGITVGEALTLNGTGIGNTGALRSISGTNTWNGVITLASDTRINVDADFLSIAGGITGTNKNLILGGGNAPLFIDSAITIGSGSLTKDGAGSAILRSTNTYTGVTTVNAGALQIQGGAAIADTGAVVVNAPGQLVVLTSETIGSLAGGGTLSVNNGSTLTTGGNNTSTTFSGEISEALGAGKLTKTGTGTFTLSGANTYGAITTINNGTLALAGGGSIANSLELELTAPGAIFDISAISGGGASVRDVSFQGGGTINLGGKSLVVTHANGDFGIGTINGGTGANALNVTMDDAAPSVSLAGLTFNTWTDGADTISITGNNGSNTITGGEGNDTIDGRFGLDVMDGGSGVDTMDVSFFDGNYIWNMATGLTNFGGETAVNFENAILGSGNDTIVGTTGANSIVGGAGADSLFGGVDLLVDTLTGGAGGDTFVLGTSLNDVVVEAAGAGGGIDTITSEISRSLVGFANVENLTLFGNRSTPLNGTGNELNNVILGSLGDNILTGLLGNDTLVGGLGNDTLNGGAGRDLFTGGGGLDRFIFSGLSDSGTTFATRDVINTFAHGDKIDLSAIDARTNLANDQAFTFIGAAAFSGAAGQLRFDMNNISPTGVKAYLVQGDVNGDRVADFTLQIFTAPTVDRTGQPQVFDIFAFDFIL